MCNVSVKISYFFVKRAIDNREFLYSRKSHSVIKINLHGLLTKPLWIMIFKSNRIIETKTNEPYNGIKCFMELFLYYLCHSRVWLPVGNYIHNKALHSVITSFTPLSFNSQLYNYRGVF